MKTIRVKNEYAVGIAEAGGAFFIWGVLPIYWHIFGWIDAFSLISLRLLISVGTMVILFAAQKKLRSSIAFIFAPRRWKAVVVSGLLIGCNWSVYIMAVSFGQLQQASLGYYINPLVSIFLGIFILKEHLLFTSKVALGIALCGVVYLTVITGRVPWISLVLAFSFGFYGYMKKKTGLGSLESILGELIVLFPIALMGFIITRFLGLTPSGLLAYPGRFSLLILAGFITVAPLMLFGNAAKKINLSAIGFLQYIAPTLMFLISVFLFRESFSLQRLPGFVLVWTALAIFSWGQFRYYRSSKKRAANGLSGKVES